MKFSNRVLLTGNNLQENIILTKSLSEEGYKVSATANVAGILKLQKEHPFSIILIDLDIIDISIDKLISEVKKLHESTQVIALSDASSMEKLLNAMRAGAADYLIRPHQDMGQLFNLVARCYDNFCKSEENREALHELQYGNQELVKANKSLMEMAIRDGLTGLYNHRFFQECNQTEAARSRRNHKGYSLVFFDIDYFKHYNDTNGHQQGDHLLKTIADIVNVRLRISDFAYRYGGEEFTLLLPETPKVGAYIVAESLRTLIEEYPFRGADSQPDGKVTISAGVTTFLEDADEPDLMVELADKAMYFAKNSGRNSIYTYDNGRITKKLTG
jgi:diguanylate cyclase (GGDEF)-like protein